MKRYTLWICSLFIFIFSFFLTGTNQVNATDIEYETYILKWDEITSQDNTANHYGKSYVLNLPNDIQSIGYVSYEIYVKNIGTERLYYNFGTYQIIDGVASEYKIRFEDDVSSNGTTAFVIRNYDIDTVEEFASSLVNGNFYQSMTNAINELLGSNLEFSYLDTGTSRPTNGYDDIYSNQTLGYSYITSDGRELTGTYSMNTLHSFGYTANVYSEIKNVSVTRLSDFYTVEDLEIKYQEGYVKGKNDGYIEGFEDGKNTIVDPDYNEAYMEGYQNGYAEGKQNGIQEGVASVDINKIREEAYQNGFNEGQASVDITSDNENIWNEAYQEGMDDGLVIGYQNGKDSVDISQVEQEAYDRGFNNGYNTGFAEGESSVDITTDNDRVIELYLTQNKLYTDYEFNLNFTTGYNSGFNLGYDSGKSDGIKYVYENIETDKTITKYIKEYIYVNKYHTNAEYVDNYDEGFKAGYNEGIIDGKEVVYRNIESDPIIKIYYKEKLINGTTINFINQGNEIIEVVKKYDVTDNSDDDFIINIHNGQDTYTIETVEEVIPGESKTNTIIDYTIVKKVLIIGAVSLFAMLIIMICISSMSTIFKPSKRIGQKKKVRNGYVWNN